MKKINDIIKLIKENEYISIFFHTNPDFDALGSSLGLKTFIQKKFVNKKVCVIDLDLVEKSVLSNFPKIKKSKQFNEKETKKSIGIVCDCANIERINSKKYESCKQIVKIDHHPNIQSYGVVNWTDSSYGSACEMVWELIFSYDKKIIDNEIASFIYAGIYTDTNRFFYSCVSQNTFKIMTQIMPFLPNYADLNFKFSERTISEIMFQNKIYQIINFDTSNRVGSLIIQPKVFEQYNIIPNSMIYLMANIEGIDIWTSIYFDKKSGKWKGSIRSKNIDISKVAIKYKGGGHKFASGFVLENEKEFGDVLKDLQKLTKK